MPIFQPRNRVQIIRDMVNRVVARSKLIGLTRNSVVFHVLAGASNEDAEQYFQAARLRDLFSIDKATGSDLDERAKDIVPGIVTRRKASFATGSVVFTREGTSGTVVIPVDTVVAAQDGEGTIQYRTTSGGSIDDTFSSSSSIPIVAAVAGTRSNVVAGAINRIQTRIPGVNTVSNPSGLINGTNRESDGNFRKRLKSFVQAITRATPVALEAYAKETVLPDGRRVLYAKVDEPVVPTGRVDLYVDDGTGAIEESDDTYISIADDVLTALGGETTADTTERPIRDDGSFDLYVNAVLQTRGVDYELNASTGTVEFSAASYPTGLTAADTVTANYRFYAGLIQEAQKIINGDLGDSVNYPGIQAAGVSVYVLPPALVNQSLIAKISIDNGFAQADVIAAVSTAIQEYINTLNIADDVIVAELCSAAMNVDGVTDFTITSLTGGGAVNQIILSNQIARISAANITIT